MTLVTTQPDQIVSVYPLRVRRVTPALPKTFSYFVAADGDETGAVKPAPEILSVIVADLAGVVVVQ